MQSSSPCLDVRLCRRRAAASDKTGKTISGPPENEKAACH
jgi:hypothetical protein